jgi:voltage-gated potassium channel
MFSRVANSPRLLVQTAVVILTIAAIAYHVAEHRSVLDSIWWSFMTATTVGYGDTYPLTFAGRAVAVTLVISMVLLFIPMVTASLASKLIVNRDAFTHEEQEEIKEGVRQILALLREADSQS